MTSPLIFINMFRSVDCWVNVIMVMALGMLLTPKRYSHVAQTFGAAITGGSALIPRSCVCSLARIVLLSTVGEMNRSIRAWLSARTRLCLQNSAGRRRSGDGVMCMGLIVWLLVLRDMCFGLTYIVARASPGCKFSAMLGLSLML